MSLLAGIDVGTSSTKVVICDDRGRVVATESASHPSSMPRAGWSEQNPEDWWISSCAALRACLARVDAKQVRGVGLSGQMHGLVLLDQDRKVLRPAILWNDQRTAIECAAIEHAVGGRRELVRRVGNAALPGFTLPKLLWVRDHEPATFARIKHILLPKDYVRWRLTGELAMDVGDASGLLCFEPGNRVMSREILKSTGVPDEIAAAFPAVILESAAAAGQITQQAAAETGLSAGAIVAAGSGDNMMGAVGAGVVREGRILATIGTSGVIYAHTSTFTPDLPRDVAAICGRTHAMCAGTGDADRPGGWCVTGCTLSAGGSLQWLRDTLFPNHGYDELFALAAAVSPGSDGLCFLPYLTGERCPHPDPTARGGFIGLTARHTAGHLVRAVLEGVTFTMRQILDIQRSSGVRVESVRLGGGGAKSELWRQMQADVYGCDATLTNTEEGPALGAAIVAGVATRIWPSVPDACDAVIQDVIRLKPANAGSYERPRAVFAKLYGDLRERFGELARASEEMA